MSSSAVLFLFVPRAFWGSCDLMIMFCDKFKSASCKTYLIPVTCWMEGFARSLSAWTSRSISTHLFSDYLILSGFESNPTFLNSNSIGNARTFVTWAFGSGDWATTPHVAELKKWFEFSFWTHVVNLQFENRRPNSQIPPQRPKKWEVVKTHSKQPQ